MQRENKKIPANVIGLWGVILSGLGALVSILSFTTGDGRQTSAILDIDYHVALISNFGFKLGLTLLILGFMLQYLERTKPEGLTMTDVYWIVFGGLIFYLGALFIQPLLFL